MVDVMPHCESSFDQMNFTDPMLNCPADCWDPAATGWEDRSVQEENWFSDYYATAMVTHQHHHSHQDPSCQIAMNSSYTSSSPGKF